MTVTVDPFVEEHLQPAAALLAARHRRDRAAAPDLPPRFADAAATVPVLRELFAQDGMAGVVAVREGRLIGFLLGAPALGSPTAARAGYLHPRSVDIPHAAHAVEPGDGGTLYQRLYAALAERWVTRGLPAHYVTVSAESDAAAAWNNLRFGRFAETGVRDTSPPTAGNAGRRSNVEVRRAGPDDAETVTALVMEFFQSLATPPMFVPCMAESAREQRQLALDHLADPACPCWLACVDGRPVSMQLFVEPRSPHWHVSALQAPDDGVCLFLACTIPDMRSSGVGAALFAHTMAWAREAGYERCVARYVTASRAAGLWRGLGFRPVSHWLSRVIDERVLWAHGQM